MIKNLNKKPEKYKTVRKTNFYMNFLSEYRITAYESEMMKEVALTFSTLYDTNRSLRLTRNN